MYAAAVVDATRCLSCAVAVVVTTCGIALASSRASAQSTRSASVPSQPPRLVPDCPRGPAVTGVGIAMLVGGGAVTAAGIAIDRCSGNDEQCGRSKTGLFGGGTGVALASGFPLAIGLSLWRHDLGPVPDGATPERADVAMYATGVVLVMAGVAGTAAALGLSFLAECDGVDPPTCTYDMAPISAPLMVIGTHMLAAGIPLVAVGGHDVAAGASAAPSVAVSDAGVALAWRF